jgi:2,3-bisphosphoglycerate-independent phosphoglycerate mutase
MRVTADNRVFLPKLDSDTRSKINAEFMFRRTFEHRAVLVIKEKLSDKISNSDPYNPGEKFHTVE